MASQLAVFYEWVDGLRPYRMLFDLAAGDAPDHRHVAPRYRHAGSFALRKFDGRPLGAHPTREQLDQVRREFPDVRLMLYLKRGASLAREMTWMGSYRYAVVNMAAGSRQDLQEGFDNLRRRLFLDADFATGLSLRD